jgi:unspecific monooxygenase
MADAIDATAGTPEAPMALPAGPSLGPADQARLWMEAPAALLGSCRDRYGDTFTLRLGEVGPLVILAEPEAARQALELPAESVECRHFNASYRYAMGPRALFLQDGAAHRRLKPVLGRVLAGSLDAQPRRIAAAAAAAFGAVPAGALLLRPMLHGVTLDALLGLVFGAEASLSSAVLDAFRAEVWRDLRAWKPWTAMSRLHPMLRGLMVQAIARHRDAAAGAAAGPADGLVAGLARARDADGAPLDDAEIEDQILMLCITAGDAVAVACAWALIETAARPDLQAALRAERAALGPGAEPGTVAAQPLLTATVQEVLRLHTVLPTVSGRRLTAPVTLGGRDWPAGVTLAPCEWLIHRRADLFDDPLAFRPERFLGRTYPAHHYFPFGGGGRRCLGTVLAPLTVRLVLSEALARLRLAPLSPEAPRPVRHGTLLAPPEDWALLAEPLS